MHDDVNHAAPDRTSSRARWHCHGGLLASPNIVVGIITQSTSVVATGVEFAGDVLASTIVLRPNTPLLYKRNCDPLVKPPTASAAADDERCGAERFHRVLT